MKRVILVFLFLVFSLVSVLVSVAENTTVKQEAHNSTAKYSFSTDWFSVRPAWSGLLARFKGKPDIRYLEIGVFEGRSLIWMLENILTHPTARATGIDIFPGNMKQVCLANLKKSGSANKAKLITGRSQEKLRQLPLDSFDIIYIDGSHYMDEVATDAVLSWPLLKSGGVIIFDDYLWDADLPKDLKPQTSIDCFITLYRNEIEELYKDYQVIVTKKQKRGDGFLKIGHYDYKRDFRSEKGLLLDSETDKEIELSPAETALIEKLFNTRGFGEYKFSPTAEMLNDEDFIKLKQKLGLNDSDILAGD